MANDWRGSLITEFRRDLGGDERDIERCEAVSASSSSDSLGRSLCEVVGDGGGKEAIEE